jgi:hypothetical protein
VWIKEEGREGTREGEGMCERKEMCNKRRQACAVRKAKELSGAHI